MSTGEPITIDRAHAVKLAEAIADMGVYFRDQIDRGVDPSVLVWLGSIYRAWHDCRNLPSIPSVGEREAQLAWDDALDDEV